MNNLKHINTNLTRGLLTLLACSLTTILFSQISLTIASYTQDFNTLANSGTSSSVPAGWAFLESGGSANTTYTGGTGSSATGDTYSFGASGSTERAFGGLQSGSVNPTIGASFINNTGSAISELTISYVGEQWRIGVTNRGAADRMDFQYSLNATSLSTGSWTDVDNLDFNSPVTSGTAGALDGNSSANRTSISFKISGLNIANGSTFWIRWTDFNITGSDDGLGIDDFSISATIASCTPPEISAPTITQPTCAVPTGTIVVNATHASTLEYSVDGGTSYQESNSFSGLASGSYNVKVQVQSDPTCSAVYASNPVVLNPATGCLPDCGGLFFSEYMEGSSFNKCLEIYNPTGSAIDLAAGGYKVDISFNGGSSTNSTNLTGTVYSGSVYIICHTSYDLGLGFIANQTDNNIQFNGDDAIELKKGTSVLDVIGQVGTDPGAEWGSGLTSTQDNTIRRKTSVLKGDDVGSDAFDPAIEWDGYAIDEASGFGTHTTSCVVPCDPGEITSTTLTQPTCVTPTGTIVVNATGTDPLDYSIDNGLSWQTSNTFSGLNPGSYPLKIRKQGDNNCQEAYSSNPVVLNSPKGCIPACTELFFSQYMEGSSFNKCLEIYNSSASPIDLGVGNYAVKIYSNGSTSPSSTTNLTGSIPSGAVFIICNDQLNAALGILPDLSTPNMSFNGDDAVELLKGTTTIDVIGQIGFDPGTRWGSSPTSTLDNTLRRKPSVQKGDDNGGDAFDPSIEWIGYPNNDASGFGFHATACVCIPPVIQAPVVIQPTCASSTGTIIVKTSSLGDFEYSVDNGSTWLPKDTITGLPPNTYNIQVRWKDNPTCMTTYTGNPIVLTAAPSTNLTVSCKPATVYLHSSGAAAISPLDVYLSHNDACISANLIGVSPENFTCADAGKTIQVTLSATDLAGKFATCTSNVTVVDNSIPAISCRDISLQLDAKGTATLLPSQVLLSESDACGLGQKVLSKSSFNCMNVGPNDVTLKVFDVNGNANTCRFFVNVIGNPAINSGVLEICDGIDNNCNGLIDEGFDLDGDGYTSCAGDCDDFNPAINPGAKEVCNGVDENCNGQIDEGVLTKWYADADGDSFGNPNDFLEDCFAPFGYVANNLDCDDTNAAIFPGATEVCDGIDNNCNGHIDEGALNTYYADADGDGYGNPAVTALACIAPAGFVANNTDCNDANALVFPGAPELCNNADDNCNGLIDEGVQATWYRDADADGFGDPVVTTLACTAPAGFVADNTDCHDGKAHINPGMPELCNGFDDNCNGLIDEGISGMTYVGNVSFTTQAQLNAWRSCYGIIDGNLYIFGSDIVDLSPLAGLTKVTGHMEIRNNLKLTTLKGLDNLAEIGGNLSIYYNNILATLEGLNNLAKVNGGLGLFYNNRLSTCCAIYNLLNSGGVRRYVSIFGNRTGCESVSGIVAACGLAPLQAGIQVTAAPDPVFTEYNLIVYPNPAQTEVNLVLPGVNAATEISIYDQLGRIVWTEQWEKGKNSTTINLDENRFINGVYLVKAVTYDQVLTKQLVIRRN